MSKKVYVAAKSELRHVAAACAEMLRNLDIEIVSTWHDDPRFMMTTPEIFRSVGGSVAGTESTRDALQILNCDVLVHLLPSIDDTLRFNTTGANFVELGMAIGLGKRCIYVGEPICVFHHLPGVIGVSNPLDLYDAVNA